MVALVHEEADAFVRWHLDARRGGANAASGLAARCLVGSEDKFGVIGPRRDVSEHMGGEDSDDGKGLDEKLHLSLGGVPM